MKKFNLWKIILLFAFWPFVIVYYICRAVVSKVKNKRKASKVKNFSDSTHSLELPDIYNEPIDKLVDGKLPKRWLYVYGESLRSCETSFSSLAKQARECGDLDEKMQLLEELIKNFYEYKKYCYSKDECFIKYFDDLWMHCHNSKNNDFCYITPFEEELNYLKNNYKSIVEYKENLKKIENEIINIVYQHPEGILQIDVVKQFPEEYKNELNSNLIYSLIKNKTIRKEKSGRYNLLFPDVTSPINISYFSQEQLLTAISNFVEANNLFLLCMKVFEEKKNEEFELDERISECDTFVENELTRISKRIVDIFKTFKAEIELIDKYHFVEDMYFLIKPLVGIRIQSIRNTLLDVSLNLGLVTPFEMKINAETAVIELHTKANITYPKKIFTDELNRLSDKFNSQLIVNIILELLGNEYVSESLIKEKFGIDYIATSVILNIFEEQGILTSLDNKLCRRVLLSKVELLTKYL